MTLAKSIPLLSLLALTYGCSGANAVTTNDSIGAAVAVQEENLEEETAGESYYCRSSDGLTA